jgi:hypothetical protein
MIKEFRNLDAQESEILLKAPVLVCILIAGADGKIDRKEIHKAISLASQKRETQGVLSSYFQEVFYDFEDKLKIVIQSYPHDAAQRNPLVVAELTAVGNLFSRLDATFAKNYYEMLLELAGKIATSSGGWLGLKSIGPQEALYVKLPMIPDPSKI